MIMANLSSLTQKRGFKPRKGPQNGSECVVTKQHNSTVKEPFQMKKSSADQRIQQLALDILPEKAVVVSFDGEDVSGNGGLLLAAQAEMATGLLKGAAARLTDHRTQSMIKHNMFELVAQRVYQ